VPFGSDNSIFIGNNFAFDHLLIQKIAFADGSFISNEALMAVPMSITTYKSDYDKEVYLSDIDNTIIVNSDMTYVNGGGGNDTYIVNRETGSVVIEDLKGNAGNLDTLFFDDESITPDDLRMFYNKNNDLIIEFIDPDTRGNANTRITLLNWVYQEGTIEQIRFFDGTTLSVEDIKLLATTGTSSNDYIVGKGGNDIIDAKEGIDQLYANDGNDTLFGGEGNDYLYGEKGDDALHGQLGNDTLYGGAGVDTFYFSSAFGYDNILDFENGESIVFSEDFVPADIVVGRDKLDLLLRDTLGNRITVSNYFAESRPDSAVVFADGTVWGYHYIVDSLAAATAGDDVIYGTNEDDNLDGLAGNDTIYGTGGDDTLSGGAGRDNLYGGTGDDSLYGGESYDYLHGDEGNDTLFGEAGDDTLKGGAGDDTLSGGAGDDTLSGGEGNDTYLFALGDGNTTIKNYDADGGIDVLQFMEGINVSDINVKRGRYDDLRLTVISSGEVITVEGAFSRENNLLNTVIFDDGSTWSWATLKEMVLQATEGRDLIVGYENDDVFDGGLGNDSIKGKGGNDTLLGGDGDDSLEGGEGNDILNGGKGSDYLTGGNGNDTYLYSLGDGETRISNSDSDGGVDTLQFMDGIMPSDVSVKRSGSNLELTIMTTGDTITVYSAFDNDANLLDHVTFSDGSTWSWATLKTMVLQATEGDDAIVGYENDDVFDGGLGDDNIRGGGGNDTLLGGDGDDMLSGGDGNDNLDGGAGKDNLNGGAGDDILRGGTGDGDYLSGGKGDNTFLFALGDGNTTISTDGWEDNVNTLQFMAGITVDDVRVTRDERHLYFTIAQTGDVIKIQYPLTRTNDVTKGFINDLVKFDDGTVWNWATLKSMLLQTSDGDDSVMSFDNTDDVYDGGLGNDIINGRDGNDTLLGGSGNDTLVGDNGNDILDGGEGTDVLSGGHGNDILRGGTGIGDVLKGGEGDDIYQFSLGDGNTTLNNLDTSTGIDTLQFMAGIAANDISVTRIDDHLYLTVGSTGDVITVEDAFDSSDNYILDSVTFNDGTSWDWNTLTAFTLQGSGGDDTLQGSASNDVLNGGIGNDTLNGYNGNDILDGGADTDSVYGGYGNDTLRGGTGVDDFLQGGEGDDTYQFSLGDGNTTLDNYDTGAGVDTLQFMEGIVPSDVIAKNNNGNLILTVISSGEVITVLHAMQSDAYLLDHVKFADGTLWNNDALTAMVLQTTDNDDSIVGFIGDDIIDGGLGNDTIDGAQGNDTLLGGAGDDTLKGGAGDDTLFGGDGNDTLEAGDGADTLDGGAGDDTLISFDDIHDTSGKTLSGGAGNDTLYGSFGDDTYHFNVGDGQDRLIETRKEQAYSNFSASNDTLIFGAGISSDDLAFERHGADLVIKVAGDADSVTIENWFKSYTDHFLVNNFQFNDGTSLTVADVNALVIQVGTEAGEQLAGTSGDDRLSGLGGDDQLFGRGGDDRLLGGLGDDYLDGGLGNDRLEGGAGNDQLWGRSGDDLLIGGTGDDAYVIGANEGHDVLNVADGGRDVLHLQGINKSQLTFSQEDDDLVINVGDGVTQSIRVVNHFLAGEAAIDVIQTGDNQRLSTADINQLVNAGTDNSDTDNPGTDNPGTDNPDTDNPDTDNPGTDNPGTDNPDTDNPSTDNPSTDNPDTDNPGTDTGTGDDDDSSTTTPTPNTNPTIGGDDNVTGGVSHDILVGGAGNNRLTGGQGNDLLRGGEGDDVFIFAKGDGQDIIEVNTGVNTIEFAADIAWQDVASNLGKHGDDLVLKIAGGPDQITVKDFFIYGSQVLSDFKFANGRNLTPAQIFGVYGLAVPTAIPGVSEAVIFGDLTDNQLEGTQGNDTLNGQSGNDTLTGGLGNDTLIGGQGDDTFVINKGDGQDVIDAVGGGVDTVHFKTGISFNDIASALMKRGNDLVLGRDDSKVTIKNFFLGGDYAVDNFTFDSGGQLSAAQIFGAFGLAAPSVTESDQNINLPDLRQFSQVLQGDDTDQGLFGSSDAELLLGGGGNDTLIGGGGNDTLIGGMGNDTYYCSRPN
jgi:Ca2+-binding RTX toxin-like protein